MPALIFLFLFSWLIAPVQPQCPSLWEIPKEVEYKPIRCSNTSGIPFVVKPDEYIYKNETTLCATYDLYNFKIYAHTKEEAIEHNKRVHECQTAK